MYSTIDDHVEGPTDEEKCSWNSYIMANVALTKSLKKLNVWKETDGIALQGHCYEATRSCSNL
jgi:hypothetical protein